MNLYALTKADVDKQRVVNGMVLGTPRGEPFPENEGRVTSRVPPHRLVQITEEVSAATYDGESPTALGSGKGQFRIARSDGSSIGSVEEEEYDILSLDTSTHAVGKTLLVYRMQDLAGSQYAEPGWVIPKQAATNDVPSFKVGLATDASSANTFTTTSTTYTIEWSDSNKVNTDTSVFDLVSNTDPGLYQQIELKVAGTYRIWYRVEFIADSTHTASEIQRGTCQVNTTAGGTVIEDTASKVESLHIDAVDMSVGLGAYNARASAETLYTAAANEGIYLTFSFSSGTRGLRMPIGAFGAQLVKRG